MRNEEGEGEELGHTYSAEYSNSKSKCGTDYLNMTWVLIGTALDTDKWNSKVAHFWAELGWVWIGNWREGKR